LDRATGATRLKTGSAACGFAGTLATAGGPVAIGGGFDGGVIDASTGDLVAESASTRSGVDGLPAIAGDVVVSVSGAALNATSMSTGRQLWAAPLGMYAGHTSPPLIVDEVVYLGDEETGLRAYDLETGVALWQDSSARSFLETVGESGMAAGSGLLLVPVGRELLAYESIAAGPSAGAGLRVTGGPSGPTRATEQTFTFEAPATALLTECRLDDGLWLPCVGSATYAASRGAHTFSVRALANGRRVGLAARGFTVDRKAPTSFIVMDRTDPTGYRDVTFQAANDDWSEVECRFDDEDWAVCHNFIVRDHLSEGRHRFQARGTDWAGNVEDPPATRYLTVDTTHPVLTVDEQPPNPTTSTEGDVRFHLDDPDAQTTCAIQNAEFERCTSPLHFDELEDGPHFVTIHARDRAGNGAEEYVYWRVDTTAPETSIWPGSGRHYSNPQPSFDIGTDGGTALECRVDDGSWVTCRSPWAPPALEDGEHTVYARAKDDVGNTDPSPAESSFVVDTVAPELVLDRRPPERTPSSTAEIAFDTESGAITWCAWDGEREAWCGSPATRSELSDGEHRVVVTAGDRARNRTSIEVRWTVDSTMSAASSPTPTATATATPMPDPSPSDPSPSVPAPARDAPTSDRGAPAIRLHVRRGRLEIRADERATARVSLQRRVGGRWRRAGQRRLTVTGARTISLRSIAGHGVPPGRYRVSVLARDVAGNEAAVRRAELRVRR
jgi:hypothetical protein